MEELGILSERAVSLGFAGVKMKRSYPLVEALQTFADVSTKLKITVDCGSWIRYSLPMSQPSVDAERSPANASRTCSMVSAPMLMRWGTSSTPVDLVPMVLCRPNCSKHSIDTCRRYDHLD